MGALRPLKEGDEIEPCSRDMTKFVLHLARYRLRLRYIRIKTPTLTMTGMTIYYFY